MRRATALLLGTLLPLLGWSGIGDAQSSVQVQGTIQAVDCQAQTGVLVGPGTWNTIAAAPYTVVLVNSTSIPLCALQQYVGAPATVWLLASGNEFTATRIDVVAQAVAAPLPPASSAYPEVTTPLPVVGIVLGTVVVAGLVYLLTRDDDGHFYRYPYYGPYYRHYYRPEYRPYFGFYPVFAPIITVPPLIVGVVLGIAVVGGLEYLLARDHDGRFYRYPYYGPYHRYYYRAEYRPYYGPYRDAPVRGPDTRWDVPTHRDSNRVPVPQGPSRWTPPSNQPTPAYRGPANQGPVPQGPSRWSPSSNQSTPTYREPANRGPVPQGAPRWTPPSNQPTPAYRRPGDRAPAPQGPSRWTPPSNQPTPAYREPANRIPAPQGSPRWTPPGNQPTPAYRDTNRNPQTYRNDRRQDAPGGSQPRQRCESTMSNQACGSTTR